VNGIVRKYIVCLFFSFDLLLLVWLSEMIRMMIVEITSGSNPYTLSNLSIFLLWIFGIVPAILLSVWLINPLSIKKLLSTFDLTEKSLDKKKEKTDVQQPEKTKDSKTSNEQIEAEIFDLVQFVDRHKRDLFTTLDKFDIWSAFLVLFVSAFIVYMAGVMIVYGATPESILSALSLGVASTALGIAAFSHLTPIFERNEVRNNYERIVGFAEKEKPDHQRLENKKRLLFLKALIKIKAKNPKFDLERIYEFNKDMFTKERLMERLCE